MILVITQYPRAGANLTSYFSGTGELVIKVGASLSPTRVGWCLLCMICSFKHVYRCDLL